MEATPKLLTVPQFSERHPAFPQPAIRAHILNSEDRQNSRGEVIRGNGLAEAGVIVRIGRRVYIDEQAFFRWVAAQQRSAAHSKQGGNVRANESRVAA